MDGLLNVVAVAAWPLLAIVAAGLVAAAALAMAARLRGRLRRLESSAADLEHALKRLRATVVEQHKSQRALVEALRRSEERIGQVELRAVSRPYEQAIRMASQGGSEDGLMRYFGLTDGEAALVRLLHGDSRRHSSSDLSQDTRRA